MYSFPHRQSPGCGTSSDLIVALFVKRNPLDLAAGLVTMKQASALAVTESSLNTLSAQ